MAPLKPSLITLASAWLVSACSQMPYSPVPMADASLHHAVVSDIDGTLTPNVYAISRVRPDAAKALHKYAERGYQIIYLSSRVGFLSSGIPEWLSRNGFPEGQIHVAQTREDRRRPDIYKTRILKEYLAAGWKIEFAFGDSSTDFSAYAAAGIPKERVFALRRNGDADCQPGDAGSCLPGWTDHLPTVDALPSLTLLP